MGTSPNAELRCQSREYGSVTLSITSVPVGVAIMNGQIGFFSKKEDYI